MILKKEKFRSNLARAKEERINTLALLLTYLLICFLAYVFTTASAAPPPARAAN